MTVVVWFLVMLVILPLGVLVVQFTAALLSAWLWPDPKTMSELGIDYPCVIVIPAHDEQDCIAHTLTHCLAELTPADRILVIADNCTDQTAHIARQLGVWVIERHDPTRRGKGYALDFARQVLLSDPHLTHRQPVLLFLDADSQLSPGSRSALVHQVRTTGRPAQARYWLTIPNVCSPREQFAAFAMLVKNVVRPLGLAALGGPCLLTGSGMALPWQAFARAPLTGANLVEDMQLGLELALRGQLSQFCAAAEVTSPLAPSPTATKRQRTRWEQGHLRTIVRQTPRLLLAAFRQGRPSLLALALELSVPPVALLFLIWCLTLIFLGLVFAAGNSPWPLIVLSIAGVLLGVTVLLSWLQWGRSLLSMRALLCLPQYVLWKVPIYLGLLIAAEQRWIRTERSPSP